MSITSAQEFPQWDPQHPWVVGNNGDQVVLPCQHSRYYPFNDIKANAKGIRWILPEALAYIQLKPDDVLEGWSVGNQANDYTMTITNAGFNNPGVVNGMYLCAAVAQVPGQTGVYSWYYLRWGVGLYSSVPGMQLGGIER